MTDGRDQSGKQSDYLNRILPGYLKLNPKLIFFSIACGNDTDEKALENIVKAANNGKTIMNENSSNPY